MKKIYPERTELSSRSRRIDFKKDFKEQYSPSAKEPTIIKVPKINFLMVDGKGGPENSKEFQNAIQALYGVTFTIKFTLKFAKKGPEYTVPPLDGLWWMANKKTFDVKDKKNWRWTLMIRQPNHITKADVADAIKKLKEKKPNPALNKIQFKSFEEGLSVQIMHIGPYSAEGLTIQKLHAFAEKKGYKLSGKHHEIYLGDPRRTAPEKLRTILRHPISKK